MMDVWCDLVLAIAGLAILGCIVYLGFIMIQAANCRVCGPQKALKAPKTAVKPKNVPVKKAAPAPVRVLEGGGSKTRYVGPSKEFWIFIVIWMSMEIVMRYKDQMNRK